MIIKLLTGAPWFVYVIFAYLLWIGIRALQPRVITLKKMFIMPALFILWGGYGVITKLNTPLDASTWVVSILVGTLVGWLLMCPASVTADKVKGLVRTHGGPSTLILALSIFCIKYFFGAVYAVNPLASKNVLIVMADLISSGVITGMLSGKALSYAHKFRNAPQTDLTES